MNPVSQGYQLNAMWWRLCGNIAETNLRVLQTVSEAGVKRANMAAVPMLAFGVYAAKSVTPVQAEAAPLPSPLSVARQNVHKLAVEAPRSGVSGPAPLSNLKVQHDDASFADAEIRARAV